MNTSGYSTPGARNPRAPRYLLSLPTQLPPALSVRGASARDVARALGTEVVGLQLAELSDEQLSQLELLVARRGVVFFRWVARRARGGHAQSEGQARRMPPTPPPLLEAGVC